MVQNLIVADSRDAALTDLQCRVLAGLVVLEFRRPAPSTEDLADHLGLSVPVTASALRGLVMRGIVTRQFRRARTMAVVADAIPAASRARVDQLAAELRAKP